MPASVPANAVLSEVGEVREGQALRFHTRHLSMLCEAGTHGGTSLPLSVHLAQSELL